MPLSGPVYLVQAPGTAILPELQVRLGGAIPMVLRGTSVARNGRLATTFAGLPDVPLSRFELSLKAGGILVAAKDLCTGTPATIDGEFVAHSGKRATAQAPAKPVGCARSASSKTRRPTATATVRGHRLTVRVKAGARRLRDARLRLGRRTVQRRPKRPARTLTLTARVTRAPRRVTVRVVDSTRRVTTLRAKVRRQPKR